MTGNVPPAETNSLIKASQTEKIAACVIFVSEYLIRPSFTLITEPVVSG